MNIGLSLWFDKLLALVFTQFFFKFVLLYIFYETLSYPYFTLSFVTIHDCQSLSFVSLLRTIYSNWCDVVDSGGVEGGVTGRRAASSESSSRRTGTTGARAERPQSKTDPGELWTTPPGSGAWLEQRSTGQGARAAAAAARWSQVKTRGRVEGQ